jgi:xylose isomerase
VNENCACYLGWDGMELPYTLVMSTSLGKTVEVGKFVQNCDIKVGKENFEADLIVLSIEDYDLMLGMDWLAREDVTPH